MLRTLPLCPASSPAVSARATGAANHRRLVQGTVRNAAAVWYVRRVMSRSKPRLYSYRVRCDSGAAPNPYWGICTLVICKPKLRLTAQVGDWVAGVGSRRAEVGDGTTRDMCGRLVYAMRVTRKMTMREYDAFTTEELPGKVPVWMDPDRRRRVGDAIYHCFGRKIVQRSGVHNARERKRDLSGRFALLSTHFFYFGENAIELPAHLGPIADVQRGHRVRRNDPYLEPFVGWLQGLGHQPGSILGEPLLDPFWKRDVPASRPDSGAGPGCTLVSSGCTRARSSCSVSCPRCSR